MTSVFFFFFETWNYVKGRELSSESLVIMLSVSMKKKNSSLNKFLQRWTKCQLCGCIRASCHLIFSVSIQTTDDILKIVFPAHPVASWEISNIYWVPTMYHQCKVYFCYHFTQSSKQLLWYLGIFLLLYM